MRLEGLLGHMLRLCRYELATRYTEKFDDTVSERSCDVMYGDRDITSYDRLNIRSPLLIWTPISHPGSTPFLISFR